ncbi:MAG TPA: hypothetical protein PKN13_00270 [Accumulibacter sp.]|nr:hypothetical protein [Accumulibacter sp.]HMW16275.1 hypothetical protein [Accumulibacter sp.]HMX23647.1 hypothetical protein [Accumulibacter sp.]HMY06890.1 hypothetical protein [Accumulibacter sp.]HNC16962.1 hypothetical protein [Accumulibacter sp.]
MKTAFLAVLAAATLAGCVVVPPEPPVPYAAPRAYIGTPGVVVVPGGYYGGHGYRHHGYYGRGYWR